MATQGRGKVLWFNEIEGRGYILSECQKRIYVHYSAIKSSNKFKTLKTGQDVEYRLFPGKSFLQAREVRV